MRIVLAPDSFKESLSALEAANAIEAGFREIFPDAEYVKIPVADGGEGTVAAMTAATGGRVVEMTVTGPLGDPVASFLGLSGDGRTAIIEMAAAAGLVLVPPARRDPRFTTTFGVGELIRAALDAGARRLVVGIGGSATNDGGAGMAQALGARLTDAIGRDIGPGGGALADLARIDVSGLDPRIAECRIEVACDVTNPLLGPEGASAVFGPQKGATPETAAILDAALARLAERFRVDLGRDVAELPGAGAAGGLGAGLVAVLGAKLRPGVDIVLSAIDFERVVADCDLVITGEGRIDAQSARGKTPVGVARLAERFGKPVIAIAGCVGPGAELVRDLGIDAVFPILSRPCGLGDALAEGADNLRRTAREIAATLRIGGTRLSI